MPQPVPLLLFTGPVGAGKTTVAEEASSLLRDAGIAHALVDLDHVGECAPPPPDDPWQERLVHRNLACLWSNFREAGAERLLLSRVLVARNLLRRVVEAVPGADITVVRLRAPLPVLQARIRAREAGRDPGWYLGAAAHLVDEMERCPVEDHVIDNVDRTARETATEALRLVRWLA
jgi:hypothetical protein